jgi:biotin-dependent carboxylase-like uncharacterized protein
MTLQLVEPGLTTLVQGRPFRGMRHLGMPLAGAADPVSLALANWLVGNAAESAALETAYAPAGFVAKADCVVAIQGAANMCEIDGQLHPTFQSHRLRAGQKLAIAAPPGGCRSYLAIAGGIDVKPVMDATSTYAPGHIGGMGGSALVSGAIIRTGKGSAGVRSLPDANRLRYGTDFLLRITDAPETGWVEQSALLQQAWTVSRRSDRIGLELDGAPIRTIHAGQISSSAVFPGTIQCPPSGNPFLLGSDSQTTGGYPRIAQVVRADRHLVGQLSPGARIRFQRIEPAEAQNLYRSKIGLIRQLQPDFRLD